jgi:hypothetical protein
MSPARTISVRRGVEAAGADVSVGPAATSSVDGADSQSFS